MDDQLRELERRWKESGSLATETALLQHLVRVGTLSPSSLELSARLGHRAASEIVADAAPLTAAELYETKWSEKDHTAGTVSLNPLEQYGKEACIRAALAVVDRAIRISTLEPQFSATLKAAVAATEDWVLSPSDELARAARAAARPVAKLAGPARLAGRNSDCGLAMAVSEAANAPWSPAKRALKRAWEGFRSATMAIGFAKGALPPMPAGSEEALAAIQRELVPWILGRGDPVAERMGARRQESAE